MGLGCRTPCPPGNVKRASTRSGTIAELLEQSIAVHGSPAEALAIVTQLVTQALRSEPAACWVRSPRRHAGSVIILPRGSQSSAKPDRAQQVDGGQHRHQGREHGSCRCPAQGCRFAGCDDHPLIDGHDSPKGAYDEAVLRSRHLPPGPLRAGHNRESRTRPLTATRIPRL